MGHKVWCTTDKEVYELSCYYAIEDEDGLYSFFDVAPSFLDGARVAGITGLTEYEEAQEAYQLAACSYIGIDYTDASNSL